MYVQGIVNMGNMAPTTQHWVHYRLGTHAHPQASAACNKVGISAIAACISKLQKPEFNSDKTLLILGKKQFQ